MSAVAGVRRLAVAGSGWRRLAVATALTLALPCTARVGSAVGAALPAAVAKQQFLEAGRAYDEGRMADAVRLYEGLIDGGRPALEVYYNLGNARFKNREPGLAVLNYRKAWRFAPRDPGIASNVRFALQATGATEAELSGPEIVFTRMSEREWGAVALAAWWSACLLLGLAAASRALRGFLVPAAAAAGFVVVAALAGLATWRGFERNPELVVASPAQSARSSPLAGAPPAFPLPEGSVVRARARQGEWVEVSSGQLTGWIRRADCAPVLVAPAAD